MKMVFGSNTQLVVGKPLLPSHGYTDADGVQRFDQPFFVVSEATAEEYLKSALASEANPARASIASRDFPFFYEVTTD